jgi:hypothetical protein
VYIQQSSATKAVEVSPGEVSWATWSSGDVKIDLAAMSGQVDRDGSAVVVRTDGLDRLGKLLTSTPATGAYTLFDGGGRTACEFVNKLSVFYTDVLGPERYVPHHSGGRGAQEHLAFRKSAMTADLAEVCAISHPANGVYANLFTKWGHQIRVRLCFRVFFLRRRLISSSISLAVN